MADFFMVVGDVYDATDCPNTYLASKLAYAGLLYTNDYVFEINPYYNRVGSAETDIRKHMGFNISRGGLANFGLNPPPLNVQTYTREESTGMRVDPMLAGFTSQPVYVFDVPKLTGHAEVDVSDVVNPGTLGGSINIIEALREKLGSGGDPQTLIDEGYIIASPSQSWAVRKAETSNYQVYGNDAGGWSLTTLEACAELFGVPQPKGQTGFYAVLNNDLSYYFALAGDSPTPPADPEITFDVTQVPTGLNVSSQLDLSGSYALSTLTVENSGIQFTINAADYEYTAATEYSLNGRDWYTIDPFGEIGNVEFNVRQYQSEYGDIEADTTISFRGYVKKKDTPTPTPSATTNTIYSITEQDLYDLRGVVIAHIDNSEVEYTDLSAYVANCFVMRGTLPAGTPKVVYLGNTNTNVEAEHIDADVLTIDCGSIDLTEVDAIDGNVSVWLPLEGFTDVESAVGHVVDLTYSMHLANGWGVYSIAVDGVLVDSVKVRNAYDLPLRITAANVQSQDSNPMQLAELKPFALVKAATDWVKVAKHDNVIVSGVPCTSRELDELVSILKDGVQ